MHLYIVDPYLGESHRQWSDSLKQYGEWEVKVFGRPPLYWKWRMQAAAISLAREVVQYKSPDLLLVTDMLNVSLFKSLLPMQWQCVPIILYMHENQITYPVSKNDQDLSQKRDNHYGFINYTSCLVADRIVFNSHYHKDVFLSSITNFLAQFPKEDNIWPIERITKKSTVIPIGLNESLFKSKSASNHTPIIIWNHRWEYDKQPKLFLESMLQLKSRDIPFQLVLLGKISKESKAHFKSILARLDDVILQQGFVEDESQYYYWLYKSDIVVSCALHEFFGISILEAIACGCYPVLPNRLSYPEHLPSETRHKYLYNNDSEFLEKVEQSLLTIQSYDAEILQEYIRNLYKHSDIINLYKSLFTNVLQAKSK